jgi:hypothetical protein
MANFFQQAGRFLLGSEDKARKFDKYTPEQKQLFSQLFQALGMDEGPLSDIFGEFDPQATQDFFQKSVADPSMRNFQQQVIPGIQQSFADQGPSSGLYNSLATAGRDLSENLSSTLAQYMYQAQNQNQQNRIQGVNSGLQNSPYETFVKRGSEGLVPGVIKNFANGAGNAAGKAMFG